MTLSVTQQPHVSISEKKSTNNKNPSMSELRTKFDAAAKHVRELKTNPGNDAFLNLYALYKQSISGNVSGARPGLLDFKGRSKYDAWAKQKDKPSQKAMAEYIAYVDALFARQR